MTSAGDQRSELPAGTLLGDGQYTVGRLLARLPTGLVYKGAHPASHRLVWITEVFPEKLQRSSNLALNPDPRHQKLWQQLLDFARRQAQSLALIQHPGLAPVEVVLEQNNTVYLVQLATTGPSLEQRILGGPLPMQEAVAMVRDLAQSLVPLHAAGLVFGWLPPSIIWFPPTEGIPQLTSLPMLGAPGMVHWLDRVSIGHHEPPEVRKAHRRPDPATDLYSLATTTLIATLGQPLPPPGSAELKARLQELPHGLARATRISLKKRPGQRPFDAADYLQFLYHQPAQSTREPLVTRRNLIALGGTAAGLAVVGLSALALLRSSANPNIPAPRVPRKVLNLGLPINCMAPDPTGQHMLVSLSLPNGGSRGEVFNLSSGKIVFTLTPNKDNPQTVAWSASGKTLLTGDKDGRIRFWDAVTGQSEGNLSVHSAEITALLFLPGTLRSYASGSLDGTVQIHNVGSAKRLAWLEVGAPVRCLAASPGGRWLAVGDDSGVISIWDSRNWSRTRAIQAHMLTDKTSPSGVTALAFSPQGDLMASGGQSRRVKLWETTSWTEKSQWLAPEGQIHSLTFAPVETQLLVACQSSHLQAIDYQSDPPNTLYTLGPHDQPPTQVVVSPQKDQFLSASPDGKLRSWPSSL